MCANLSRQFAAGELECANCGDPLPAIFTNAKKAYACDKTECRSAIYGAWDFPKRYIAEGEMRCMRPGCENFVPAGWYGGRRTQFYCHVTCQNKMYRNVVVGQCLCCGADILDAPHRLGQRRFLNDEHKRNYYKDTRLVEIAGVFIDPLQEYLQNQARTYYTSYGSYTGVKNQLLRFTGFLNESGLNSLDQVEPDTITDYINHEIDRGINHRNYISMISVWFDWRRATGRTKLPNPVIHRFHAQTPTDIAPRPYEEYEMSEMSGLLEERGTTAEQLAFAIGEECGMRGGEVANVRMEDVDQRAQRIFVRLPTKTKVTRRPIYGDKVKRLLPQWLQERQGRRHNHLLEKPNGSPSTGSHYFQTKLRDTLCAGRKFETGIATFSFHRLRHTWATRLANAGMDAAVIMELGGWKSWAGMQRYIRLCQQRIDEAYHTANQKRKADQELAQETVMGLEEFAFFDVDSEVNDCK